MKERETGKTCMVGVLLVLQAAHWHILLMVPDADIVLIRLVLYMLQKTKKKSE
jgi:hypothetical protein